MELELRRKAKMWKWNDTAACEQSTITVAQRDSLVYRSRPKAIAHITGVDRRFEPPLHPRKYCSQMPVWSLTPSGAGAYPSAELLMT